MKQKPLSSEKPDAPAVIMLPPTMLVMFIAVGIAFNWLLGGEMGHGWGWLGLVLMGAAFFLTKWAKDMFADAGTNVNPQKPALAIVTDGPFQHTRNPMYVSFLLLYAGLALLSGSPWMLLLLFPLFYILDQKVITPEEEYLAEKFGEEYTDYKARVRRWI